MWEFTGMKANLYMLLVNFHSLAYLIYKGCSIRSTKNLSIKDEIHTNLTHVRVKFIEIINIWEFMDIVQV